MKRARPFLIALLAFVSMDLHAQYGPVIAAAASQDPLTVGAAIRLVGAASGSIPPETTPADAGAALERLGVRIPRQSDESPITLGSFCYLLGQLFDIRAGAMYGVIPGPRSAFLEMSRRGLLSPHARAGQTISGADALLLLHRFLAGRGAAGSAGFTSSAPTFAWGGFLGTVGQLTDLGAGPVLDTQHTLGLNVSLAHQVGPGIMTYRLGAAVTWLPQQVSSGQPQIDGLAAYPEESGASYEIVPRRLQDLWFRASIGRLAFNEPTGLLLYDPLAIHPSQLADGFLVELRYFGFYASAGAGYLGLLEERLNRIRFTPQDELELADPSHYFAPPRVLAVVRAEAQNILFGQSAGLFGIGQVDARGQPPTFNSWYVGAAARGPIGAGFRHETSVVVGIAQPSDASTGVGILASALAAYRLPVSFLHETWLSVLWASGPGGGLGAFPQLAGPPAGSAFAVPLTDIVRVGIGVDADYEVGPAGAVVSPSFQVRVLLSPDGQIPPGFSFQPVGSFIGTEVELAAVYHPLDDVRVFARAGGLITEAGFLPYIRLEAGVEL